jgi:hypothetical protein
VNVTNRKVIYDGFADRKVIHKSRNRQDTKLKDKTEDLGCPKYRKRLKIKRKYQ